MVMTDAGRCVFSSVTFVHFEKEALQKLENADGIWSIGPLHFRSV